MNIFVLDVKPSKAAEMLCNCHVRKMCMETAQILSGVMLRRKLELLRDMPKLQNLNHPVIVAADSDPVDDALDWVLNYNFALHKEYAKRFGHCHAYSVLTLKYINELWSGGDGDCTKLSKCCGDLDVEDLDIVTAYRKYYTEVKKPALANQKLWKFTNREDWTIQQ